MPDAGRVAEYYGFKNPEYIKKYGQPSGITHIHVGLYRDAAEFEERFSSCQKETDLTRTQRLREFLQRGQNATLDHLQTQLVARRAEVLHGRILDCGAGLGGTAAWLASKDGAHVDALTVSPEQGRQIAALRDARGLQSSLTPIVGDIFAPDKWASTQLYDLVVGIDALSQMGSPQELFRITQSLQNPRGVICFYDVFLRSAGPIKAYYDEYWVSDMFPHADAVRALRDNGYRVLASIDLTDRQLPYWRASLDLTRTGDDSRDVRRREETIRFHTAMLESYERRQIEYRFTLAEKVL